MGLNWEATDTWWLVDQENKMMTPTSYLYGIREKHDSVEQTYHAYYTYGDERFLEGIKSCWKRIERTGLRKLLFGDYYYQGQRYPTPYERMKPMSRDHLMYSVCAFKKSGMSNDELYEFVSHLPFLIGKGWGLHMTLRLWLWLRLVCGKKIGYLYYPINLLTQLKNTLGNKIMYWVTGFGEEEHQSTYKRLDVQHGSWPKLYKLIIGMFYPTYAIKLTANQLKFIPENWFSKQIKKTLLKVTPRYNYVLRLMLGDNSVTKHDVEQYRPSSGDRWADIMNKWMSDRYIFPVKEKHLHVNTLDKDYLIKLYNEQTTYVWSNLSKSKNL